MCRQGFVLVVLLALAPGCTASVEVTDRQDPSPGLLELMNRTDGGRYRASCGRKSGQHGEDLRQNRYVPPWMRVSHWNGREVLRGNRIDEDSLVSALRQSDFQLAVVMARGGLGKSRLADALEARLCSRIPVFRLDVGRDIVPAITDGALPEGHVLQLVERIAGVTGHRADWQRALKENNWILLIDALDEVSVSQRMLVVKAIEQVREGFRERASVVLFTRPPVFSDHFGLNRLDVLLEIEPLQCGVAQSRVEAGLRVPTKVQAFWRFARTTGLDRKIATTGGCLFQHLATYRDIKVALAIADDSAYRPFGTGFDSSRASVYRKYVEILLRRKDGTLGTADEKLRLVSGMMDTVQPDAGLRVIWFTEDQCRNALRGLGSLDGKVDCRDLLETPLFEPHRQSDAWRFRNQSITDFFLADWADRRIGSRPGPAGCSGVFSIATLLESSEVASFLVGMPQGSQCLIEVLTQMCVQGCSPEEAASLVAQGLGRRVLRKDLLAMVTGLKPDGDTALCVSDILDRLTGIGGEKEDDAAR